MMSTVTGLDNPNEELWPRITLDQRPGDRTTLSATRPPIRPRQNPGTARLSFAQERLWFLDQINPGDLSSNISRGVRIIGATDINKLNQAVEAVVARHESLRTTFAKDELQADSRPAQLVKKTASAELRILDLSSLPEANREQEVKQTARYEAQRPFDLSLGPLLRLAFLRLTQSDSVLLLNTHRIVCDEYSSQVFFDELSLAYRAFANDQLPQFDELPIQYADYAEWQREWLRGNALEGELDYWKKKLGGAPSVIDLPLDHTRPAVQTWHGAATSIALPKTLANQLRALSEREEATLFVILLAAFQVLLARYSQQTDLVIGSAIDDERDDETRRMIGPVTSGLPLRLALSGNPPFRDLISHVGATIKEARAHRAVPFEKLIEELTVERSLSHAPIFQVMLQLKHSQDQDLDVASLQVAPFDFETGITPLDLILTVTDSRDELKCRLEYNTDLFDEPTVTRMLGHLKQLLAGLVTDPEQPVERLQLLTETERRQIVAAWNKTGRAYSGSACIHGLFESQAKKTPGAIALECRGRRLTYAELNVRANQLAHYLMTLGVGAEVRVGVCLERSAEMLIGVLAVLKAGGAYVPLEPGYPRERLAFMVEDAGATVVLGEKNLSHLLPQTSKVVCVDSEQATVARFDSSNPVNQGFAENLAYVIYTSGSTGRPKGVAIQHGSTVAFLNWAKETFGPQNLAAVLASTSLSFDLSVFELFAPLCSGGKVVLVENALQLRELKSPDLMLVNTVPSAMAELVHAQAIPPSVRTVNLAGEPLPGNLVQAIYEQKTIEQVFNLYGPSETTTYSTFARLEQSSNGAPSIGRPISNTTAYVLDLHLEPVPIGVRGELCLGGAGLARCYLDRKELTASKFIPDPFSARPGARLYRTGDVARYGADGNIQFVGRADHQVKIRGFRIELGEIEVMLRSHATVRDAIVMPRAEHDALVAYVVVDRQRMNEHVAGLASVLRSHLATKLPDYMVPWQFIELEALPLTPNGKVDRLALSLQDEYLAGLKKERVAPRDELEANLAKVWEQVLGLKSIGIRDNFFELGGQSLLAARLFAQIENRFRTNLPLATLFQAPTVEQLAAILRAGQSQKEWSSLVAIQPKGARPPLFCVHAAGANVLIYRPLARHLGLDQPVYAFQARGLDGQSEPYRTVAEMAVHYLSELRAVQPAGPYYLLGASFGGLVAFEMAQRLIIQGEPVALLALLNTNCPVYSVAKRIGCHLGHLKERGAVAYLRSGTRAAMRRVRKRASWSDQAAVPDRGLQEAIASKVDKSDPLVRTVLANLGAENDYAPVRKQYPGKITLFWAKDAEQDFEDNRLAWRNLAGGGFEVHEVPGNHTTMREEPNIAVLVEELRPCLKNAQVVIERRNQESQ